MTGHRENVVIEISAITHRGLVRKHNEDSVSIDGERLSGRSDARLELLRDAPDHLLMIADGMGGHARGDLASSLALEYIQRGRAPIDALEWQRLIKEANNQLYDFMLKKPETSGMGTTLVGVAIHAEGIICFNVGDSRAYLHRANQLRRLSHDDVPDATGATRRSHQITQSLGGRLSRAQIFPHIWTGPALRQGETILLCSDGLTDMVTEEKIEEHLRMKRTLSNCANSLLDDALEQGGLDNISVVIARVC